MLLKPEEASVFDLIRILFSGNVERRKFVECPAAQGSDELFRQRWVIFLSILVQKLLKLVSKPLASFGTSFEYWLNLLSSNGNFFRLVFNFLRGKVIIPDEASASYASFVGHADTRLDLDKSIKQRDHRYYSALSIMAAKLSYESKIFIETTVKNHWKMDFLGSFDFWNEYQEKATTQAFMLQDRSEDLDLIVVAFRGTEVFDSDAWSSDVDLSWYELPGVGKVHAGFMKALGLQKSSGWPKNIEKSPDGIISRPDVAYYAIREMLRQLLQKNDKAKFIVTGHSLGGALAILFPAILICHEETLLLQRLEGVYTFGQPRVGDDQFGEFMTEKIEKNNIRYYRFVYCNDIVPRLPFDNSALMFKHFGTCVYVDSFYSSKIVEEEPNKNYFSALMVIPKFINAIWELIRSFTIGYRKGDEYKESGLLRFLRVVGLIIAGLPVHYPQDYVNATRLASPNLYLDIQESRNTSRIKIN